MQPEAALLACFSLLACPYQWLDDSPMLQTIPLCLLCTRSDLAPTDVHQQAVGLQLEHEGTAFSAAFPHARSS